MFPPEIEYAPDEEGDDLKLCAQYFFFNHNDLANCVYDSEEHTVEFDIPDLMDTMYALDLDGGEDFIFELGDFRNPS